MINLDLFSGIGGFALACEWAGIETIGFVEIDKFCQKVLRKHWPNVPIVEDIHDIEKIKQVVTNAKSRTNREYKTESERWSDNSGCIQRYREFNSGISIGTVDLITGGFPCQPFSVAGKQRGKEDDRYLWPAMLNVIQKLKPTWVIGENVAGIVNMALDTVLSDLADAGYEVQPFVIPACAVNAPHRRDRVWIIANAKHNGRDRAKEQGKHNKIQPKEQTGQKLCNMQFKGTDSLWNDERKNEITPDSNRTGNGTPTGGTDGNRQTEIKESELPQPEYIGQDSHASNTINKGLQGGERAESHGQQRTPTLRSITQCNSIPDWSENWYEVATEFCRVAYGIPDRVDRLKSLGNAIVPQVVYQILKGIAEIEND